MKANVGDWLVIKVFQSIWTRGWCSLASDPVDASWC
jgi:hypothetical protein